MEAEEEPVKLGAYTLQEKTEEKYLGDIFSSEGLSASIDATIKERAAKIKGSIYELRAVIEDFRMQAVGGMEAAIDLYESCIVPSLIANCATWLDIKKETEDKLDSIQDLFGRVLLKMPQSTPRLAIRGALGLLGCRWRVYQEKVLLLKAIKEQEEGCLAKQILEEQIRMGWPGLAAEVQNICKLTGLQDITKQDINIDKSVIKKAIQLSHLKYLKDEMTGVKLEIMKNTDMRTRRSYTK